MPATASVTPTGDVYVDGVLSGIKWGVNALTFSFPTDPTFYGSFYGSGENNLRFLAFTATQQAAVRTILADVFVGHQFHVHRGHQNGDPARRSALRRIVRQARLGPISDHVSEGGDAWSGNPQRIGTTIR